MADILIHAKGLDKSYPQGAGFLRILRGIDLDIYQGEAVCIVGESGAGKSTLLHLLGTLDRPTLGNIYYRGENLTEKKDDDLAQHRSKNMGFIFQFHYLLSEFTALENLIIPARIAKTPRSEARSHAEDLLRTMGLLDRAHHYPSQLSGGEQQRVAVARALMNKPEILFADEPTGNLDTENSRMVQDLCFSLKAKYGLTLVMVTHDTQFAGRFPRVLRLKDGQWSMKQGAF